MITKVVNPDKIFINYEGLLYDPIMMDFMNKIVVISMRDGSHKSLRFSEVMFEVEVK